MTKVSQKPLRPPSKRALKTGVSRRGGVATERGRFRLMWGVTITIFAALLGKAFWVQVINQSFYAQKASSTIGKMRTEVATRGVLYDRFDAPLALSVPMLTVSFNAREYAKTKAQWLKDEKPKLQERLLASTDSEKIKALKQHIDDMGARFDIARMCKLLGVDVQKLLTDIANTDAGNLPKSQYRVLVRRMPSEEAGAVLAHDFVGLHSETEYKRYYTQPQPNTHLLGYMGRKDNQYVGRAGLELQLNNALAGQAGKISTVRGARGFGVIDKNLVQPDVAGQDTYLSIDARLQYILYRELEKAGREHKARSASGLVLDARTGEVLAVSNWPSFNANDMRDRTNENERNRAIIDIFEPGSVMKPLTVAAALDSGKFNTNSRINTGNGTITIRGKTFRGHGPTIVSLEDLIIHSNNVASIKIAQALPLDGVTSMYRRLGLGQKTALGFPGEQAGSVTDPGPREDLRRANITFGYSVEVTLAQLAQAYAVLANDGKLTPLSIMRIDDTSKINAKQVITPKIAQDVLHMMEGVTEKGGTGTRAAISGYRVAGKTGTAKKLKADGSGYYDDKYRGLFVGIAPISNPRFVTAIVVEDPVGDYYGGSVAAPAFATVTKEALRLYHVPQDKPLDERLN